MAWDQVCSDGLSATEASTTEIEKLVTRKQSWQEVAS